MDPGNPSSKELYGSSELHLAVLQDPGNAPGEIIRTTAIDLGF